jgi:hypothetical protein
MRPTAALVALLLAAGCASFDGRSLQPGKSTTADVTALMGTPALTLKGPDGETLQYFERYLTGPAMFVARLGPDGVLRGIEQRLVYANIHAVKEGMRAAQVRELLGPPYSVSRLPRPQRGLEHLAVVVLRQRVDRVVGLRALEARHVLEAERVQRAWYRACDRVRVR